MKLQNAWILAAALALAGAGCGASAPAPSQEAGAGDEQRVEEAQPQLPPAEPGVEEAEPQGAAPQEGEAMEKKVDAMVKDEPAAQAAPKNVLVRVGANGFDPANVSANVGDTVTWVNDTTAPIWIASNPHPVHTDYPEFDSKSDLRNGESWSFKFMKAGTWKYHNHFQAFQGGSVTVK